MPPGAPGIVIIALSWIIAATAALVALGRLVKAFDYFRECVRRSRIRARVRGWGGPEHPNQELTGDWPTPTVLEMVKALLMSRKPNTGGKEDKAPTA
jgi:hypothetical protein